MRTSAHSLLLAALFAAASCRAEVFVSVQENGTLLFTDRPVLAPDPHPAPLELQVQAVSKRHGLDPLLIHAVIRAESNFNPRAVSPKGAAGLMQLMPDTARRYGVADRFDPAQNLEGGARYLKDLLARFGGDLALALAAYNAGEAAVLRYGRVPPFPESQQYVVRVKSYYASRLAPAAASFFK